MRRHHRLNVSTSVESDSERFTWGYRIGKQFVAAGGTMEFAETHRYFIEEYSLLYLREMVQGGASRSLQEIADDLFDLRNAFAAAWEILTPELRDRVGLPDVDGAIVSECKRTFGEAEGREYAKTLLANRSALENLKRSLA